MKATTVLFAALTAGVMVSVSGCGSTASTQSAPGPSSASSGHTVPSSGGDAGPSETVQDKATQTDAPAATVAPVTSAPNGSGHGLCFDLNSALANSAIKGLPVPSTGAWTNPYASNDPISAGCDGVLSWMTVESGDIHPYTHVLFFTNGAYLGTATADPYGYTEVLGKSANVVSVRYRWAKSNDALCCPTGGPSVVTFTLSGGKVQANGQFPPGN